MPNYCYQRYSPYWPYNCPKQFWGQQQTYIPNYIPQTTSMTYAYPTAETTGLHQMYNMNEMSGENENDGEERNELIPKMEVKQKIPNFYKLLEDLKEKVEKVEEENEELKEKLEDLQPINIENINYKIQELSVEELSGTLNIGITALTDPENLKQLLKDFEGINLNDLEEKEINMEELENLENNEGQQNNQFNNNNNVNNSN